MTRADSALVSNVDVNQPGVEIMLYNRSAYDLWLADNFIAPTYLREESISDSVTAFVEGRGDVLACLKPKLIAMQNSASLQDHRPSFHRDTQAIGLS